MTVKATVKVMANATNPATSAAAAATVCRAAAGSVIQMADTI